jgi:hypothetical protein
MEHEALSDSVALRVPSALARAATFLLVNQDAAGTWQDFSLPPGRSDAWTTAYVGYALLYASTCVEVKGAALKSAAAALVRERRPEGWGYNKNVACDADSTSWVLRFLAWVDGPLRDGSASLLIPFVTEGGGVRTFESKDRLGSWAADNDEVTAVAGLSLCENGEVRLALRLRERLLQSWTKEGWQPFWWRSRAYVRAQAVEFLRLSGGIPARIAHVEMARISDESSIPTDFEESQMLMFAVQMRLLDEAERRVAQLLKVQCEDGGWHMSVDLRVPQQKAPLLAELYGDDRRLFTTASALRAVSMWYLSTGKAAGPLVPAGHGQLAKRYEPMKRSVENNQKTWVRDRQTYICKQVTDGLRAFNLWISDVEFRQQHLEQSILGHSLLMNILLHSSECSNYALIFAESIFGYEDYRFEKQLKRLLAFGGTLGEGLSSFVGVSESAKRRAKELCSILNFGASIFDMLVDDIDVDRSSVFDLLGNGQLKKLVTDPTNIRTLNNEILRLKSAPLESRLVLTAFSNLFTLLHKSRYESSDLDNLGDLFTEAYETELRTVKSPHFPCDGTLKSSALNKSVLLFQVMLQLACTCDRPVKPSSVEIANTLSIQIGRLFALVDDFADFTEDALTGSVNSILIELDGNAVGSEEWRSLGYRALIDRFIEDLCHNLAWICNQLEERAREERTLAIFRTRLLFYVRSWLE